MPLRDNPIHTLVNSPSGDLCVNCHCERSVAISNPNLRLSLRERDRRVAIAPRDDTGYPKVSGCRRVSLRLAGRLVSWAWATGGWLLTVVRRKPDRHHFEVLPRRWVVERTLAWLSRCRRLSKDYEERTESSEAWVHIAMVNLMLKRLQPS